MTQTLTFFMKKPSAPPGSILYYLASKINGNKAESDECFLRLWYEIVDVACALYRMMYGVNWMVVNDIVGERVLWNLFWICNPCYTWNPLQWWIWNPQHSWPTGCVRVVLPWTYVLVMINIFVLINVYQQSCFYFLLTVRKVQAYTQEWSKGNISS